MILGDLLLVVGIYWLTLRPVWLTLKVNLLLHSSRTYPLTVGVMQETARAFPSTWTHDANMKWPALHAELQRLGWCWKSDYQWNFILRFCTQNDLIRWDGTPGVNRMVRGNHSWEPQ